MQKLYLFVISFLLVSCSQLSQTEKELNEVLNTSLELKMFETVLHRDSTLAFIQLRETHEFLILLPIRWTKITTC